MKRQPPHPPLIRRLHRLGLQLMGFMLATACAMTAAQAQTPETEAIDPPGRVGSITLLAGPVDLVDLDNGNREPAALNWPVTAGWRLDTGRLGRAEVRIGSTALRLDEDTTVDFARLDDHFIQVAVLRGSVALRLRNRGLLDEFEVVTQRERIVFDDVGRYRIDVDQAPGHTAVTAFAGRARIASGGSTFVVGSGQRGEVTAPPLVRFQLASATGDRFDQWVAARDSQDDSLRSAAYVSRETTGVELLDDYGDWRPVGDYGPVWFPRTVPSGWAPYRYGRWAWVDPWGWTWVDEAPWGFAPFHYGRWVILGGAWGWVPGVIVPRPIYAPALVAWFGAPGVSVSIGAPIGWFPLGPREVYVPAYRYSPRYLRVVNVQHVPNVERVTIVQTPRYVHRHPDRSTWVSGDRFGRRDPVHRGVRPPPSEWRQYIARPQPPANVPNTKRRQNSNGDSSPATRREVPSAAPVVRPAMPRAVEAPSAIEDTRPFAPSRPAGSPRATEAPSAIEDTRPFAPSRPAGSPRATEAPSAIEDTRPFAAPRAVESPRREIVRPPSVQPREPRGRGELPAAAQEQRRIAPRGPAPEPVRPPEAAPPAGRSPSAEAPGPRGRGEHRAPPRNEQAPTVRPPAPVRAAPEHEPPRRVPPQRPEVRDERPGSDRVDRPTARPQREMTR